MEMPLIGVFVLMVYLTSEAICGLAEWKHFMQLVAPPAGDGLPPTEEWMLQGLDHFDPSDERTWRQRYFTNGAWFGNSSSSPVFLMINGESPASTNWITSGAWTEYAKKFNALCFLLEHRFYGESQPKGFDESDMSVDSLRYLNSEQSLTDVAYFIEAMNEKYNLTSMNKWVVFGGSYAGTLAAWARLKYPHLVHAAVSSSAPLQAVADFKGYDEVVRQVLTDLSPACAENVNKAALLVESQLKASEDVEGLAKKFNCCSLNVTDPLDLARFVDWLATNFRVGVQYLSTLPFVHHLCEIMTDEKMDLIDRYANASLYLYFGKPGECLNVTFKDYVEEMRGVSAVRAWTFQTCTEFGFYHTSSPSLFGSLLNLDFYVETCKRVYGEEYDFRRLTKGIERTNVLYGGFDVDVSNVVFVQGSWDPWHVLGLAGSSRSSIPVILINGTSHCADMESPSPDDPVQLVDARKEVERFISEWLSN